MLTSVPQLTLDEVNLNFQNWRAHKKGGRIPEELWQQIRILEQCYSPSLIRRTLSISGKQYCDNVSRSKEEMTFVEVSANAKSAMSYQQNNLSVKANTINIEIQRTDGSRLFINHLINNEIISNILSTFLR